MLLYSIIATFIVSLVSIVGILAFFPTGKRSARFLRSFVGLAVGTLLAVVFFDILPEMAEDAPENMSAMFGAVLASIFFFFIIEKIIHYHHCGCKDEDKGVYKTHLIINNLVGDGLHNFIDGTIIAGAFLTDFRLGVVTTVAVIFHEIPQEVSDFSILVYSGLSRLKAAIFNVAFGLTSVAGAVAAYFVAQRLDNIIPYLLAVAAGNFIYLAMADLIPELQHEDKRRYVWQQLIWVGLGVVLVYGVGRATGL